MRLFYLALAVSVLLAAGSANGQGATESQAGQAISQAEKDWKAMSDAGFGTVFVNDTLLDARNAFGAKNYRLAVEKTDLIAKRRLQAYNISDSVRALQLGIEEVGAAGLDTTKAGALLNKSVAAFQQERYEEAEGMAKDAYAELASIRSEATIVQVRIRTARDNIISFVRDNVAAIIAVAAAAAVLACFSLKRIEAARNKNKIRDLEVEREVLKKLMKDAQYDRFQKRTLSKESYEIRMGKYKERMIEIKEMLPVLRAGKRKGA